MFLRNAWYNAGWDYMFTQGQRSALSQGRGALVARQPAQTETGSAGVAPASDSIRASQIASGVLPAPPTVKLPTQTTGTPQRRPGFRMRRAATAP